MAEQPVPVGPGARAAAAGLDAEQVVEQRDDEVVVQVVARRGRMRNETMDSRAACWLPSTSMPRAGRPSGAGRAATAARSRAAIRSVPTACLRANTSPARMDSTMAGVPPSSRATGSSRYWWPMRVDERHGSPARDGGHLVADQSAPHDQHAWGLRAARELVRGKEHRVLVIARTRSRSGDPDRHVRSGGSVVPERQGAAGVQQRGRSRRCRSGCRSRWRRPRSCRSAAAARA